MYPVPTVTAANRPFVEGWKRGKLTLQHCLDCECVVFFPRELCPRCWSQSLVWKDSKGKGRIISFSLVYSHVSEPFVSESPIVLAEIELEDGGALLARVVTDQPEAIVSGALVELVSLPDALRFPLPTFMPK
jgi:uncharacterized OB-fold protein